MRRIYYIFTILFSIILLVSHVNAECTSEELNELKTKADEIKITYEHLGAVETPTGPTYDYFDVRVKNVPDDYYVIVFGNKKMEPENNLITIKMSFGEEEIDIYSNKCDEKLKTISFKLPRFNIYSLDPLCEDIDGDDFSLCDKYYDYDVSYDNFVKRVTSYRNTHNVTKKEEPVKEESIFDKIIKIIKDNIMYIGVGLSIVGIIIGLIVLIKNRKKRGVLE